MNEELKKFAEKYNWELEVGMGNIEEFYVVYKTQTQGKNHSHYIDFQAEFL